MQIPMAYICVILIWSTTPLAIQWSSEHVGYLFAVMGRMDIGVMIAVLLCALLGHRLPLHKGAVLTYLASGIGGTLALLFSYISVQYIPSGWLSVIFGLSPILTSILAGYALNEDRVNFRKASALLICIVGLSQIYQQGIVMGEQTYLGILYALLGVIAYSLSLIAVKAINADIKPVSTMTGTLLICAMIFTTAWVLSGQVLPETLPFRAAGAIFYLGVIGSVLGFMLFYFLLQRITATRVALITLITPITALILGNQLNDEPLTVNVINGSLLVLFGLLLFEFSDAISTRAYQLGDRLKFIRNKYY